MWGRHELVGAIRTGPKLKKLNEPGGYVAASGYVAANGYVAASQHVAASGYVAANGYIPYKPTDLRTCKPTAINI